MSSTNQTAFQIITLPKGQLPMTGIPAPPGNNRTVINTTNIQATPQNQSRQGWSTGLFGCLSDISVYCLTCFCPCVAFGRIAEIIDRGATSCGTSGAIYVGICHFLCCVWIYTMCYRTKMRKQYNLPQSPCPDCCAHCLCHKHALCQEYRELENRGFDLSIGWQANIEKMNAVMMVAPGVPGGMPR
ncbi:hypothetical protein ACH5RR_036376 [Cinchona calisaya]|uniref:Uncharacterized protein n=1 Tax=Cinchona calisaya TaxID=153742 RepID=A0ABD2Y307_9GENT